MSIIVRNVSKSFGAFEALRDVSVDIPTGTLMALLGPSGGGKSTLLRIIAGLETQDAGTIVQDGHDVSRLSAVDRDYGIVFQSYALFPNLTIESNVAYGLVNRRDRRASIKARVVELLTLVGLPDAGRDGALREELRGAGDAGHGEAARFRAGRLRKAAHQERLRVVGEESRQDSGGMVEALRRQVGAEVVGAL